MHFWPTSKLRKHTFIYVTKPKSTASDLEWAILSWSDIDIHMSIYLYNYISPLNLLTFLHGKVHLPFLELSFVIFWDQVQNLKFRSVNSIVPDKTAQMCRLVWLCTGGKGYQYHHQIRISIFYIKSKRCFVYFTVIEVHQTFLTNS